MLTPGRRPFGAHEFTLADRLGVWLSQRTVRRHLSSDKMLDLLEIGCGFYATNLLALKPHIRHAVAVDFEVSELVKKTGWIRVIEAPAEVALSQLSADSFDVILIISVLEHLWNPAAILRACHDCLRPGGAVLINVPTWLGKTFLEFSAFRLGTSPKEEMDDHKMYYDKRDLWPLLIRAGFAPSRVFMSYHKLRLNLFAVARKTVHHAQLPGRQLG